MINSTKLAKIIVERYNIQDKDALYNIGSMIENHVLTEINKYVNMKNMENINNSNNKEIMPKIQDPTIQRVQVWPRSR